MFNFNEIWGYPTDTSFAIGVMADDVDGLLKLARLKGGRFGKYFSLMCADEKMLRDFSRVPDDLNVRNFFFASPRTAILEPSNQLPKSRFWPDDGVAFRISTIRDLALKIDFPITATSANLTGQNPIFELSELQRIFGDNIKVYNRISKLTQRDPSEIWDFTKNPPKQIR